MPANKDLIERDELISSTDRTDEAICGLHPFISFMPGPGHLFLTLNYKGLA